MALSCGISCVWRVHVCNVFSIGSVKCGHNDGDGRQNVSLDQNNNVQKKKKHS